MEEFTTATAFTYIYTRIHRSGEKDIIVVFQSSSGTEVHGEDIHIFDGVTLEEYRTASLPESTKNHVQVYTEKGTYFMMIAEKKYTVNTDALFNYEPSGEETFYINNEYYEYRVSGDTLRLLFVCGISKYGTCGYLDVSFKLEGTEFVFDTAEFIQYEGDLGNIS